MRGEVYTAVYFEILGLVMVWVVFQHWSLCKIIRMDWDKIWLFVFFQQSEKWWILRQRNTDWCKLVFSNTYSSLFVRPVNHLALIFSFVSPVSPFFFLFFFWPNPESAVQLSAGTPHFWWTPSLRRSQFSSLNMQIESVIHLLGDKSATLSLSIMPLKIEYQINF